ncbi:MAG: peptidylprolyl isomerase [Prevotella sp.]|nr:peptidylprolyl isomerase [Prevotella sp.]
MRKLFSIIGTVVLLASFASPAVSSFKENNSFVASSDTIITSEEGAPNVIDEVIWVVGDEPILKSDVEVMRIQGEAEGYKWKGNPDCAIPEQIAVQKLFLHQAGLDSIEVTESEVTQEVEDRINWMIQQTGSREKLEEYRGMSLTQIRQEMRDDLRNQILVQRMRQELVKDVSVTPADVRRYFQDLPQDSLPFVPTTVELQIITRQPRVEEEEVNRIKNQLREYTERVNNGETTFATLARLYSEDGSARAGGELGYTPRAALDPAFASVAFGLTDPKKISKIVETEFGYHIIQLVDKSGDRINVRHILLKPRISSEAVKAASERLDSLAQDIRDKKFTFDDATYVSDDKDTRMNRGLMAFYNRETGERTSRFRMQDLPTEIAREVEKLQVGEISASFQMVNDKGKNVCAIIKLKARTESHRATIAEDFQILKGIVLNKRRDQVIHDWVVNKIKNTYVRMNERYRDCDFEYEGWVK